MTSVVAVKQHARLGASSAYRWMVCPGSIRMSDAVPTPGQTKYAAEGTAAHALAELVLRSGEDPARFHGRVLEGFDVTDDMIEYVRIFTDYARNVIEKSAAHFVEFQFSLDALKPPEPMFGTADLVAYDAVAHELEVADLKYGRGEIVEVKGNKQTRVYALGAVLELFKQHPGWVIKRVKLTIVQPRAPHVDGAIRSETIEIADLLEFANELLVAAHATQAPDAPLAAGKHCQFCPAAGLCPEQYAHAQRLARVEFSDVTAGHEPPAPTTLPDDVFYGILPHLGTLQDWITAMWARLRDKIERGEPTPGWKPVAKRANRSWIDEEQAAVALVAQHGLSEDEVFAKKLKSPAQIEKVTGQKNFPAELVQKVSSGTNIVPTSDPRPAVAVSPASEFTAITDGE